MLSRLNLFLGEAGPLRSAIIVLGVLILFSIIMPLITGLHAQMPADLTPNFNKVSFAKAIEDSIAGKAVIVDLRTRAKREESPVKGGAITAPESGNDSEWKKLMPLMESLVGTPVYVILPPDATRNKAFRKLRSFKLNLFVVEKKY